MIECDISGYKNGKSITGKKVEYIHTVTYNLTNWVSFSVTPNIGTILDTEF